MSGLLALVLVAVGIGLFARLRGRQSRFERARVDRVEDADTPLERELFAQGCSSVRVVPMDESMSTGPHEPDALWIECWSEAHSDRDIGRLPTASWPPGSHVQLHGAKGAWSTCVLQDGNADRVAGSTFYSPHMNLDRRSLSSKVADWLRAMFQ